MMKMTKKDLKRRVFELNSELMEATWSVAVQKNENKELKARYEKLDARYRERNDQIREFIARVKVQSHTIEVQAIALVKATR